MGFWYRLKKKLGLIKESPSPRIEAPKTDEPIFPVEPPLDENQFKRWVRQALEISMKFEGNTPWANITGNFDGMGLTCGALGWTIHYGDQQRLVLECIEKHGESFLLSKMPAYGPEYLRACKLKSTIVAKSLLANWSGGSSKVDAGPRKELEAFWQSPQMIDIQILESERTIGAWALQELNKCKVTKDFRAFAWFFDTRVLNGSLKGVQVAGVNFSIPDICQRMKQHGGYNKVDAKRNADYWPTLKATVSKQILMSAAWERSTKARSEFVNTTMNRRGTLSMDSGYVNGKFVEVFAGVDPDELLGAELA